MTARLPGYQRHNPHPVKATYDDLEAVALAYDNPCPRCTATPGHPCTNVLTDDPLPTVHWQRINPPSTTPENSP